MPTVLTINDILAQVKQLDKEAQLTLLEKIVRLLRKPETGMAISHIATKYKGAMSQQPLEKVDEQLNDLRHEWE
jgi:hypothetical protein